MEIILSHTEADALKALLKADISDLLFEIARTDNRDMREGLKAKEELLMGILDKIEGKATKAA